VTCPARQTFREAEEEAERMPHPTPFDERQQWIDEREAWRQSLPSPPQPDFLFGLNGPRPPDPRDWSLAADPAVAEKLAVGFPEAADLTKHIKGPPLNQGAVPSCVSHTMAHMQAIYQQMEEGVWRTFDAPRAHRETGAESTGRWPDDLLRYCVTNGMPLVGSNERYKIQGYAFVAYDGNWENTIKAAIAAEKAITLAMLLPSNFSYESSGAVTSGYHEVDLVGYRPGAFLILNSWGSSWGRNGLGWVPIEFLKQNNWQQRYVLVHAPVDVRQDPNPPPPPPDQFLISHYVPSVVKRGGSFAIHGAGFKPGASYTATWGGASGLVVSRLTDKILNAQVPASTVPGEGVVRVIQDTAAAIGPVLVIQGDDTPTPPPPANVKVIAYARGTGEDSLKAGTELQASGGGFVGSLLVNQVERTDPLPPPPGPVQISGYQGLEPGNRVRAGASFTIIGKGFAAGVLQAFHGDEPLAVLSRSEHALQVKTSVTAFTAPVFVQVEAVKVEGPAVTVYADDQQPVGGLKVTLAFGRTRGILYVVATVRDAVTGQFVPAMVEGTAGGVNLPEQPTNSHGYVQWRVGAVAVGVPVWVKAEAADGSNRSGEERTVVPRAAPEIGPGFDPAALEVAAG
jgi:hypothetical protein